MGKPLSLNMRLPAMVGVISPRAPDQAASRAIKVIRRVGLTLVTF